jgi:hypothetical protein
MASLGDLRDDLRNLDLHLEAAETALRRRAGGLGMDALKGMLAVVYEISSVGDSAFPSTEEASMPVMDAMRTVQEVRHTLARLGEQASVVPGIGAALDRIICELDDFPVNETMSHRGFSAWARRVATLRSTVAHHRASLG